MDEVEHWANQDEVATLIPVGVLVKSQTGSSISKHCTCRELSPTHTDFLTLRLRPGLDIVVTSGNCLKILNTLSSSEMFTNVDITACKPCPYGQER